MEGAQGNSKSAVDAGVKVTGHPGDSIPLHEGEACALSGIEEDMIDASSLRDCKRLVNHDLEAKRTLIEGACRPRVVGCEADVVNRHGLWLGYPRGGYLNWLGLRIAGRDQGHRLNRDS